MENEVFWSLRDVEELLDHLARIFPERNFQLDEIVKILDLIQDDIEFWGAYLPWRSLTKIEHPYLELPEYLRDVVDKAADPISQVEELKERNKLIVERLCMLEQENKKLVEEKKYEAQRVPIFPIIFFVLLYIVFFREMDSISGSNN